MTNSTVLEINHVSINVVRKDIKNIHLAVYPPDANVRISAPKRYDNETIKLFAISKWGWIKDSIEVIKNQNRIPPKEYVSGESHYLFGKRYMLKVVRGNKSSINISGMKNIVMTVRNNATRNAKKLLMENWYRQQLRTKLEAIIPLWEQKTGLKVNSWQIKKMKTHWGTCNISKKIIYLNLELAKRKPKEIEYVVLHELSHIIERTHNKDFVSHLQKYMPNWELHRRDLNEFTFEDR